MLNAKYLLMLIVLPPACLMTLSGCKSEPDRPVYKELDGKVIDYDADNQLFKFEFFKDGKRKVVDGALAADAEILINGRTANMKEIRINEDIHVRALIERVDGEYRFIAKKVTVERDEEEVEGDQPGDDPDGAPEAMPAEPVKDSPAGSS